MRDTRLIMGMPIMVDIPDGTSQELAETFDYFTSIDERFSTYKDTSEISRINRGEIHAENYSSDMQEIFAIAQMTKEDTGGYFDIFRPDGLIDPSGIVKGWAIYKAALRLSERGVEDFLVDAGGDVQSRGKNSEGGQWSIGIRHPFEKNKIAKVVYPHGRGVATSGSYIRGAHIYNPLDTAQTLIEIVSLTVIGPNVLEADRFATAAFAMGRDGINFIEHTGHLEGYAIDKDGIATYTTGFEQFLS